MGHLSIQYMSEQRYEQAAAGKGRERNGKHPKCKGGVRGGGVSAAGTGGGEGGGKGGGYPTGIITRRLRRKASSREVRIKATMIEIKGGDRQPPQVTRTSRAASGAVVGIIRAQSATTSRRALSGSKTAATATTIVMR